MTVSTKWLGIAVAICWAVSAGSRAVPTQVFADPPHDNTATQSRLVLSHALPELDGHHLKVSVVEITYGPRGSSPPHSHPCPVVGYVVEGAIRMHVKDEPEVIHKAGDSFYEAPNGVHLVAENMSDRDSAKVIVFPICDHDAPIAVAVPRP